MKQFLYLLISLLTHSASLEAYGQRLTPEKLRGNWKLLKEVFENPESDRIINDQITSGAYSDTLRFMPNNTYVRSNGAPYVSTGNWSITGNRIATTNSRFEPAQTDAILFATYSFDDVEIRGDTLSFIAQSELTGRSFYVRIK